MAVTAMLGFNPGAAELIRRARAEPLAIGARSFVFLRHGETEGNAAKIFQTAEQPLNARGLDQARMACELLSSHRLSCIRASTMERAWRTAEIVAEPHRLAPEPWDLLRERWFGSLIGTSSAVVDWAYDPPGGELLADFIARTRAALAQALDAADGTAVVAHGGTLYVLAFGLAADVIPEHFANATPLLFERRGRRWQVTALAQPLAGRPDNIA